MNDEIKEILSYLKKKENTRRLKCITIEESKHLLDYITNLQTIEKLYDNKLSENKLLKQELTNLQQENERLKELNENASKVCMAEHRYGVDKAEEARDYKSRCEKASELIDLKITRLYHEVDYNLGIEDLKDIENILQNGSDDNEYR